MRQQLLKIAVSLFLLWIGFSACLKDQGELPTPPPTCDSSAYCGEIKTIIDANCAISGCHVTGFASGDFSTYAGIKEKVDLGVFRQRVIVDQDMPPAGPLNPFEIQKLDDWISAGAPEK